MILGAVLAGGASRRFGSDKALAMRDGRPLIAHVVDALATQVDAVVVCGRDWGGLPSIADRPAPGLGPLGGLDAALHYATVHGFATVVSAPCDTPSLPAALVARLGAGPCHALGLPVIGAWPASLTTALDAHLAETGDRSMRGWIARIGARAIDFGPIVNINAPADLSNERRSY